MQGRVGNITVLFSHCVKKKATLEEVCTKRSGPRRTIRQCEYRILFYQICIFEFAVKLRVADFIDKKIVMQSLTCWKNLCNFFVIEKQSREEEVQPIKFCFRVLCSRHVKDVKVSFRWLINYKSIKDKKYYFWETCWKKTLVLNKRYHKSSIKPPRGLNSFKHFAGGGGLI